MLRQYLWKYHAPDEKDSGGGQGAILKAIETLSTKHTEQVEAVKTQHKKDLEDQKKALEAANKILEDDVASAKAEAQKAIVKADELEKQMGTKAAFGNQEENAPSFNQLLKDALTEKTDDIIKLGLRQIKSLPISLKAVGDMALGVNYTGGTVFTTDPGRRGIITEPNRRLHIRDIPQLPKGTMTGSQFPYLKENGTGEGNFTTVAEGGLKPQLDFDLIEATAQAEYIAGILKVSKKMLADVPGLITFLQARLLNKLLLAEDDQMVNGNGTSPNLAGITKAGNFTAAAGSATIDVEQLIQAISQMEEMERTPDAILIRPSDFWNMAVSKASGSGEYNLPDFVSVDPNGQLRIAGIPAYRTTAMAVDKFIVGDFSMGALLLQREAPVIEFFEQNEDDVKYNRITIRVEERIAFPIFGPGYFIYGDFGNVA